MHKVRLNVHSFIISLIAAALSTTVVTPAEAMLRTVVVSNNSQLSTALSTALPGDEIILTNGNYAGFSMTVDGTGPDPNDMILIKAQNQGQAIITSGTIRFNHTAYVTVEGLTITTSGSSQSIDGETFKVVAWFDYADDCRLTRCTLNLSGQTSATQWVMLGGNSNRNRIDHCEFGPNNVGGHLIWPRGQRAIAGVTFNGPADRENWANGGGPFNPNMARHTLIDHNYFHDHLPDSGSVSNGETIVLGGMGATGDYQDTHTIVEHNLWVNCWGDSELISIKTSSSTIRYNTVRGCGGAYVSRAGNNTQIYGNFMLQGGRTGSQGIRIHEMNHKIYDNYIENTESFGIQVYEGNLYDESNGVSFTHAQVVNAQITHNTIVNPGGRAIQFGAGNNELPAENCFLANNVMVGSGTLFSENTNNPSINMVYSQNIIWPQNPGKAGFVVVNPQLTLVGELQRLSSGSPAVSAANTAYFPYVTDDMDGQARDVNPDIGADEFSNAEVILHPLTVVDVGPFAGSTFPIESDTPMDQYVTPDNDVVFEVVPVPDVTILSYEWFEVTGSGDVAVGTDSPVLTIANAQETDAGRQFYGVVTTDEGAFTSRTATIRSLNATLILHIPFDDGTATDVSGSGNHGTLEGTAAVADDPERGKVVSLDGSGGKVELGNPASLNVVGECTVMAWVYNNGQAQSNAGIVQRGHQSGPSREFILRIGSTGTLYDFGTWSPDQHASLAVPSEDVGAWVHLAGTMTDDGGTFTYRLYRNGVEVAAAGPFPNGLQDDFTVGWAIGARGGVAGFERVFNGLIDDVRIYDKPLCRKEIQRIMNDSPPGDVDGDRNVNFSDFSYISAQWGTDGSANPSADIAPACGDDMVDMQDLELMTQNFLESN